MSSRTEFNKKRMSPSQIRTSYYGSKTSVEQEVSKPLPNNANHMTPSTRFIIRCAKRKLGESQIVKKSRKPDETELYELLHTVEKEENEELSEHERTLAVVSLSSSLEHYDILTPLVENPEINDIIVTSYDDISIQTNRANIQSDLRFPDHESYQSFIESLLESVGKSCTTATPVVDVAVDPHVRACVTHESFSPAGSGPMLTLRIARHRNISLEGLVQSELAPRVILEYLASIVRSGKSTILIAGEVGTGKTTLVKALLSRVPDAEAILIIEDTHELVLQRKFVRTLLTREANTEGSGKIPPAQAIRTGMRMAMNRLVLGEMRDAEAAEAFIDVCASGHAGISTIHSRSAKDAISRLELLLSRAQNNASMESIRRQIANAVSVVVYLGVDKEHGTRRLTEVLEVGTFSDGTIQFAPIFSYLEQQRVPAWRREGGISAYQEQLKKESQCLPSSGEIIHFDPERAYKNLRH